MWVCVGVGEWVGGVGVGMGVEGSLSEDIMQLHVIKGALVVV